MKRLLLLFTLLALLAAPALANGNSPLPPTIIDLKAEEYRDADGDIIVNFSNDDPATCRDGEWPDDAYLTGIYMLSRAPSDAVGELEPEAFLVRWTARGNGHWRRLDRPDRKLAGNHYLRKSDYPWWGEMGELYDPLNVILPDTFGRGLSKGSKMRIPIDQPVRVKILPVYKNGDTGPGSTRSFTPSDHYNCAGFGTN